MRITLLSLFCSIISLSASAQWWKLKKLAPHPEPLEQVQLKTQAKILALAIPRPRIKTYTLSRSAYSLEVAEALAMKTAQHNMRYRVYDVASYNFSDLAQLYVQQNRYSEAKWYFLQSTFLARQQNNNKLTISNLTKLALVKSEIGDFMLAQQDLFEAREIAAAHGWLIEVIEVEKKLSYIQHNRFAALRNEWRYAELASAEN
jgi:hypothetical protein